jgi:hypothetical protein
MNPHISEAVLAILGSASFKVHGETYEDIEWLDEHQSLPSKEAVLAKLAELQAQYEIQEQAKIDKKEAALAKLAALGLSEEEFKILIGN